MTREEAIEVYNGLINQKIKEAFEFFTPELKESEDERIRKEIIKFIQDFCNPCDPDCDKWIAWLEKQKSKDDEEKYLDGIKRDWFERGKKEVLTVPELYGLEKQKEQKPISFSEPYDPDDYEVVMGENTTSLKRKEQKPVECELEDAFKCYTDAGITVSCGDIVAKPEEQKEQKQNPLIRILEDKKAITEDIRNGIPTETIEKERNVKFATPVDVNHTEWSDEDEKMKSFVFRMTNTFYNWTRHMGDDCEEAKKAVDWVKNLSQRLHPESEWSEEDEKMLNDILGILHSTEDAALANFSEQKKWLKSLRPSWKL